MKVRLEVNKDLTSHPVWEIQQKMASLDEV